MSSNFSFWLDFFQGNGTFEYDNSRFVMFSCWVCFVLTVFFVLTKKNDDPNKHLKRVPSFPFLGNIELIRGSIPYSFH